MIINPLLRWDPILERDELGGPWSSWLGLVPRRSAGGEPKTVGALWAPRVDITEDDQEYLIKAELPGVAKEAVKVQVENGVLQLSGDRAFETAENGKRYHRVERAYGSFARGFTIPEDADGTKVTAEFREGLLTVHLAKIRKAPPQTLEIKVA